MGKDAKTQAGFRLFMAETLQDPSQGQHLLERARSAVPGCAKQPRGQSSSSSSTGLSVAQRLWLEKALWKEKWLSFSRDERKNFVERAAASKLEGRVAPKPKAKTVAKKAARKVRQTHLKQGKVGKVARFRRRVALSSILERSAGDTDAIAADIVQSLRKVSDSKPDVMPLVWKKLGDALGKDMQTCLGRNVCQVLDLCSCQN